MIQVPEPHLNRLYQEVILDHNKRPRNFKEIRDPACYSHGINPLCGDDYHLYLQVDKDGVILDAGFKGAGCAISKASASMMTTMIKGKHVNRAHEILRSFIDLMTKDHVAEQEKTVVDRMIIFEGVREFPIRVKCATLIWRTLENALKQIDSKSHNVIVFEKGETMKAEQLSVEITPNPNTLKFVANQVFIESGSYDFPAREKAKNSPLALKLFDLQEVAGVLIGSNFIAVTKTPQAEWQPLIPPVVKVIQDFLASGKSPILEVKSPALLKDTADGEIEKKIRAILDEEIRPAVARDGGDIIFYGYKDGVVTLHLQGACSHCPAATMTLKLGVESRLKESIPEIKEVVEI